MESFLLSSYDKKLRECPSNVSGKPRAREGPCSEAPKVVVAIPAYNEEIAIGSLVLRILKYADEVVVVDDGSTDHTAEVARLAGGETIAHKKNCGYGAAIKTCFNAARQRNADVLIIIDADGQHDPDDIPKLIANLLNSKSDIVIGSRFVNGNGKNQKIPAYRKFGMKVLDMATNAGTGLNVSDSQSGFRAYSRDAVNKINLDHSGMSAGSEILIKAAERKLKISEVPVKVRYDLEGTSSKNPVVHGLGVLSNTIRLISQRKPVLFYCIPGTIMIGTGTVCTFILLTIFNAASNAVVYGLGAMLLIILGMTYVSTGLTLASIWKMGQSIN